MSSKGVTILGSTGSIGTTALRVLQRQRERFHVAGLTAFTNAALLEAQAQQFKPTYVGLVTRGDVVPSAWCHGSGDDCLIDAATRADVNIVLNAVVGAAGLKATLAALGKGKRVALANKESLVMGGSLVMDAARAGGGELVPVDSEHSAILQCIAGRPASEVRRLVLTASGGPFREWSAERIEKATLGDALRHPTWQMGRKITIDSATLANKALEVIEAHFLFGIPYDCIDVVVHPQSVVHSFVEFIDGSVLAQLGAPSMELPILYALTFPDRVPDGGVSPFDPVALSPLQFEPVRRAEFPALDLGIAAGRRGGVAPAVFNAANEQAVACFLSGMIRFGDIPRGIESALSALGTAPGGTLGAVLTADAAARRHVQELFGC
ncbi:MAG: 1-deoxy-D-xylulose-5-phosphate reductoisomerase [Gemmatimonadota bacterium]|nr:1-deoxy-D-xylulose-5-phosphate reductoisomerase [Gemmatimonadota bacterium]